MPYINFNHIAKRCPNGQWKDPENGECISQAEWKRKYRKNAPIEDNEEKKKGKCPKGYWKDRRTGECIKVTEWKDRPKARGKKKEPKEESKYSTVKYEEGMTKPESLQYVMGFTREAIKKEHPEYFENAKRLADSVREKTRDAEIWQNDDVSVIEAFKETLSAFEEYGGISVSSELADMPKDVGRQVVKQFADTIEEYPWAMASFGGFGKVVNSKKHRYTWMYCSYGDDRKISINTERYYKNNDMIRVDETSNRNIVDPIVKGDPTPWGFHFSGATQGNCISHEWGHACDIAIYSMYRNSKPKRGARETIYYFPLKSFFTQEKKEEMSEGLKKMGYEVYSLNYGWTHKTKSDDNVISVRMVREKDIDKKQLNEFLEPYGLTLGNCDITNSRWGCSIEGDIVPIEGGELDRKLEVEKLSYEDSKELRSKSRIASRQFKEVWQDRAEFSKKRVSECEELYKELYDVKNIAPTDCYTRYGYYGSRKNYDYEAGAKGKLTESSADERMAEAMQDVMVRKDKANSMSQLMVAHMDFEMYQIMTGDFDMTFRDFIKDKIGFDRFKDRIVKAVQTRYISFTPYYAKVRQ